MQAADERARRRPDHLERHGGRDRHRRCLLERPRLRRLAWPGAEANLDRRPHHPRQDIQAWQSLLLNQVAPSVKRVAVLRDPTNSAAIGQFSSIQTVAPALSIELFPLDVRNASAIERGISAFATAPNGGLF